jgi:hypothetical protein
MKHLTLSAFLLFAGASAVAAQEDALLPTHLIDGGNVFATGTLRYLGGKGDAALFNTSGDIDQTAFQYQLDAGVGLGQGFEIDASIAYTFTGTTTADFGAVNTEFETESKGFSDLLLEARYRILQESKTTPQLFVGGVVVAPVGNDKDGQPEIKINGITAQNGEDAGVGGGVWHYGFEAGISKNLIFVEPYLATSYILGDTRTKNGVHEDAADTWTLLLGAQWYVTPKATIDTRVIVQRNGVEKSEDGGVQSKEEAHLTYTGQASLYVHLGGGLTLMAGGGVSFVEDHEINDLAQLSLKDDYAWFFQVGLHILIGPSPK